MLASGKPVSIDGREFEFDRSKGQFYAHGWEPRNGTRPDIPGAPQDQNLQPGVRLWKHDDWSGGEGSSGEGKNFFSPDDPSAYDQGTANVRIPGQLSGPPGVTSSSTTPGAVTAGSGPILLPGHGNIWLLGDENAWTSTNGSTWSASAIGGTAGDKIISAAADTSYVYIYTNDTPGGSGTCSIRRLQSGGVNTAFVTRSAGNWDRYMAVLDNYLLIWNGAHLRKFDTSGALPYADFNAGDFVYQAGPNIRPPVGAFYDIISTDNSVVFFTATTGQSLVWEFKSGTVTPLFSLPLGFTARAIGHALGWVYIAGVAGTKAALYRYQLGSGTYEQVAWIRRQSAVTPTSISSAQGTQVLIGTTGGQVFVYDAERQAVSLLDSASGTGNVTDVAGFANLRLAVQADTATFDVSAWASDETASTRSWSLDSGAWEIGAAQESKTLFGVTALFSPISGSETITLSYQTEESGSWTQLGSTITSATTGASTGRVYIAAPTEASTLSSYIWRWRTAGTAGAVVKRLVMHYYVAAYDEVWDMWLILGDEHSPNRDIQAQSLMDYFTNSSTGIIPRKRIVTFLNGTESPRPGSYSTTSVVVESPALGLDATDPRLAQNAFGGSIRLRLRNVAQ